MRKGEYDSGIRQLMSLWRDKVSFIIGKNFIYRYFEREWLMMSSATGTTVKSAYDWTEFDRQTAGRFIADEIHL